MGGISYRYQQISEFQSQSKAEINLIAFNEDFSILFFLQEKTMLLVCQYRQNVIHIIQRMLISKLSKYMLYIDQPLQKLSHFLMYQNLLMYNTLTTSGIYIVSLNNINQSKYLRLFQIKNEQNNRFKCINSFILNKYQNLLVLGVSQKTIQFWKFNNQWEMVQDFIFDYIEDSVIENMCFNQQETQLACQFSQCEKILVIYQYNDINRLWFLKQAIQMGRIEQYYLINENQLLISEKISECYGLTSKPVFRSYVQQKNNQFEIKTHLDEYITLLCYSERASLLLGYNSKDFIFLKLKDNGDIIVQQRLPFPGRHQSIKITPDLKYFVICYDNIIKIFKLFQK